MHVDTHCHIDMYQQPEELLKKADEEALFIVAVTLKPSHFKLGLAHIKSYKNVRFALGMHPLHVHENTEFELNTFKDQFNKTSYIGEIGLDFSKEGISTKNVQIRTFEMILGLLQKGRKFITVHSRKAEEDVLSMLKSNQIEKAVFHWYSGSVYMIPKILDLGHFFSVNPYMVNSSSGLRLIKAIPPERILVETDGPYQRFNGRMITPFDIYYVYEALSKIWNMDGEDTKVKIWNNFINIVSDIHP